MQDDEKSTGPDSVHDDQPSDLDSKVNKSFICSSAFTQIFKAYVHCTLLCLKPNVHCSCQINQTQDNQINVAPVGNDD